MNNTKYVANNWITKPSTLIKTPSPPEDPNYPARNMLDPDRNLLYAAQATGGDMSMFFDIGTGKTTDVVGFVGLTQGSLVSPSGFQFNAGNVFPKDGTWSSLTLLSVSGRTDHLLELASPVGYRYWEVLATFNFNGFMLSRPLIGQKADLGLGYSRGTSEELQRSRVREPGAWGRSSRVADMGPTSSLLSMVFLSVTDPLYATWKTLGQQAPFLLIHPILGLVEVDLAADRLKFVHQFGPPNLWDITADLEQLP